MPREKATQSEKAIVKSIGKRIQKLRKEKGYTQQCFAEKVGISTNYLSDIERGKSSARLDKLISIVNALECSADDIFADVIDLKYKIKSSQLSEQIEKLPTQEKEKVLSILQVFIESAEKSSP